ncbi:MAG: M23 family metallopeptidase [Thermacetogeniaceae bacterium]
MARRYLYMLRRGRDLIYRLLAALVIFVLAWVLVLTGGTVGQLARSGVAYVLNTNYELSRFNWSPVVDQVSVWLGLKRGLDVKVGTPIPQGGDVIQQPGLPATGQLARGFGWQKGSDGWPRFSTGVELVVAKGAEVRAVLPGKVNRVVKDPNLGTVVVVDHNDQLSSLYGRLSAVGVQPGQQVEQGQVLGATESTFLHFEMKDGDQLVDPVQRLQQKQT